MTTTPIPPRHNSGPHTAYDCLADPAFCLGFEDARQGRPWRTPSDRPDVAAFLRATHTAMDIIDRRYADGRHAFAGILTARREDAA